MEFLEFLAFMQGETTYWNKAPAPTPSFPSSSSLSSSGSSKGRATAAGGAMTGRSLLTIQRRRASSRSSAVAPSLSNQASVRGSWRTGSPVCTYSLASGALSQRRTDHHHVCTLVLHSVGHPGQFVLQRVDESFGRSLVAPQSVLCIGPIFDDDRTTQLEV